MVMRTPDTKTVLAVDHDARALLEVMNCLSKAGFNVLSVTSSDDALKILRGRRVDAITLNASLPGEADGFHMANSLRADPRTRDIPIILLATNGEMNFAEKCKAAGLGDFMAKPWDMAQLVAMVKDVLSRGELKQVNPVAQAARR
jgi:PleD family two-component response regulator